MTEIPQSRRFRALELLILALGIGLRLARYLDGRPLWLDESMIALNILSRPLDGFFRPLDAQQIAPLGFLWGEWVTTRLAGTGEHALRLLPLMAGIAGLIAFARLARHMLEPGMALVATTLAALSPLLIFYSAEVKPYGFDWLGAVLVMLATLTVLEDPSRRAWIRWGAAAALSALLSTAAPLFVGGCALALVVEPHVRRSPRALLGVAAAGTPAAVIFALQLFTAYHSPSTTSFMQVYWSEAFLEPRLPAAASQAVHLTRDFWSSMLFAGQAASLPRETMNIVLGFSLIGTIWLGRRSLPTVVMLFAPAVLAGVASLLKAWPLTPRLLLFGAPAVLITLPAGLAAVSRLVPSRARIPVQAILAVALIAAASIGVGRPTGMDRRFIGVREALREFATRAGADAAVYLSPNLGPSCVYYLMWHPDRAALEGEPGAQTCALRGRRTLVGRWPLFVGLAPGEATSAAKTVRPEWLDEEVRRIRELSNVETWLLIGDVELKTALPGALEKSGATKLADSETRGIRILKYRP